ncbi:nucleopolyhedrovirus P10 family protein [Streptomyces sp. NPDC058308]|uniref:nucleopolyhedrovirus P10 family protein n=1 Tax=Streptomyces sp. NPDC058308 TaxID=3346440 RepID=UPI0036E34D13
MTGEGWTQAVRRQLGFGRVLPLGGAQDGAWVTESAVDAALRQMADGVFGVRLGIVRIASARPDRVYVAAVPAPPSALPPGPLRITAEFAAAATGPLPAAADRLRAALSGAADQLGLVTEAVDLKVTALLDEGVGNRPGEAPAPPKPPVGDDMSDGTSDRLDEGPDDGPDEDLSEGWGDDTDDKDAARVGQSALSVPGVARLTGVLGRAVHLEERPATGALPRRHARVELATDPGHRALDVALAVRAAVGAALPDHPTVAVLVTEVGREPDRAEPGGRA